MKLTKDTLEKLHNCNNINQNIIIKKGNELFTIDSMKSVLFHTIIDDTFDKEVYINDLGEVLDNIKSMKSPDIKLYDNYLEIHETQTELDYFIKCWYADKDVLVAPKKLISMPSIFDEFDLTMSVVRKIKKNILNMPDISIIANGNDLILCMHDKKDRSSNKVNICLGKTNKIYTAVFKVNNFDGLLVRNYKCKISHEKISQFKSFNNESTYFMGLEPDSVFYKDLSCKRRRRLGGDFDKLKYKWEMK